MRVEIALAQVSAAHAAKAAVLGAEMDREPRERPAIMAPIRSSEDQLTLRVYDAEKKAEIDKSIAFDLAVSEAFLAGPSADDTIEIENRPNWNTTEYTPTLAKN